MTTKATSKPKVLNIDSFSASSDKQAQVKQVAKEKLLMLGNHYVAEPAQDLANQVGGYAKRKPDVAALWCFVIGVLVGWKLKG